MSQLFLYSNSARLIDAVIQKTAVVLSMDDGQKFSVIKNHVRLVPLPGHTLVVCHHGCDQFGAKFFIISEMAKILWVIQVLVTAQKD